MADAVLVTNNLFEGSPWRRPRLDEGLLEVHLLAAPGFVARTRAALAVMTGEWRALRHLTSLRAARVTLRRPGRGRTRVSLDGEVTLQRGALAYAIVPQALRILAANPDSPRGRPRHAGKPSGRHLSRCARDGARSSRQRSAPWSRRGTRAPSPERT